MLKIKYLIPLLLVSSFIVNLSNALNLPQEIELEYSGPYGIPAKLKFSHDNQNYNIETVISIPFKNMRFSTKGKIINNQLFPTEYIVYRDKKPYSQTNINYDNKQITYGKLPTRQHNPLSTNTQDLFSIAWQMTINQGLPLTNTHATNGKKIYELPMLNQTKDITHYINNKKQTSKYFTGGEDDRRLEVGLAEDLFYVPSVIVYYDKGTRYELTLRRAAFK